MPNIEALEDAVDIQCRDGSWNYNSYMHGMANGMIFALAVLKGDEPKYLEKPERWLADIKAPAADALPD